MKKKIVKLSTIGLILLFTHGTYATEKTNMDEKEKKPVDEALEHKPKEDTIKGGGKLKDKYHNTTVSLSSIENSYQIKRSDLHFPPYKCYIYHSNTQTTKIGISKESEIKFEIDKSLLNIGDIIVVTNSLNVNNKNNPFGKFIVEEIEIVE